MPEQNQQPTQDTVSQPQDTPAADEQVTEEQLRENVIKSVKESTAQKAEDTKPQTTSGEQPKEQGDPNANRMALQIARLEKQNREQKAAFDKYKEDHDSLVNALKDPDKRYELLENQFGATYQDWTDRLITGNKEQRDARDIELDNIKQTVSALQSQLEEKKQSEQKQADQQQYQGALVRTNEFLDTNKEKYPVLHTLGRGEVLLNELYRLQSENQDFSDEEVAADLEKQSVAVLTEQFGKLLSLDVINTILSNAGYSKSARKVSETEQTQRENQGNKPFTLTNDLQGQPSSGFDYLNASDEEIRDHARKSAREAVEAERRRQDS